MKARHAFDEKDIKAFEAETKIGLLATVNPEGLPHLSLITTQRAKSPTQHMWGQFSEGQSKKHVRQNPKTGFLVLTTDRGLWRGKALWNHSVKEGPDYELFNTLPMFRYNAYFGIHTVHYMDLVETFGRERLPIGRILAASLSTALAARFARRRAGERVMNPWTEGFFNRLLATRFLAYVGGDGFPVIVPLLQCRAADSGRLVFSDAAYAQELSQMAPGQKAAVLGLSFAMESVLVRGPFWGFERFKGLRLGVLDVDWVYNSMPPVPGQIYPPVKLEAVKEF